jgi:hypothetical protein
MRASEAWWKGPASTNTESAAGPSTAFGGPPPPREDARGRSKLRQYSRAMSTSFTMGSPRR